MYDVGSITGKNLRRIMLQTGKDFVEELTASDVKKIEYFHTPEYEEWRPILLKELIKVVDGSLVVDGFTNDKMNEIIKNICVN